MRRPFAIPFRLTLLFDSSPSVSSRRISSRTAIDRTARRRSVLHRARSAPFIGELREKRFNEFRSRMNCRDKIRPPINFPQLLASWKFRTRLDCFFPVLAGGSLTFKGKKRRPSGTWLSAFLNIAREARCPRETERSFCFFFLINK